MEEFIGVIGILGSSIRSLEEFRGVLGILASNYLWFGGVEWIFRAIGSTISTREKFTPLNSSKMLIALRQYHYNSSKLLHTSNS